MILLTITSILAYFSFCCCLFASQCCIRGFIAQEAKSSFTRPIDSRGFDKYPYELVSVSSQEAAMQAPESNLIVLLFERAEQRKFTRLFGGINLT